MDDREEILEYSGGEAREHRKVHAHTHAGARLTRGKGRNRRQDMSHPAPNTFQCEGMVGEESIIFFMVTLKAEKI